MKAVTHARTAAASLGRLAARADNGFVCWAGQLHDLFIGASSTVARRAIKAIPAVTERAQRTMVQVGESSEKLTKDSDSILLESLAPAAYRTATVVGFLGRATAGLAESAAEILLGHQRAVDDQADAQYQRTGERVATMVREGLDPFSVGRSLRRDLRDLQDLDRRQRRGQR